MVVATLESQTSSLGVGMDISDKVLLASQEPKDQKEGWEGQVLLVLLGSKAAS